MSTSTGASRDVHDHLARTNKQLALAHAALAAFANYRDEIDPAAFDVLADLLEDVIEANKAFVRDLTVMQQ